ncbi:uncharacterized protein LOC135468793 [Liolophura sinensis]|uniref:uncharacterized protein LOC135468793 n=1 Tax=Liolophura sinensis TaxID=3198878 RepID=UPI0031589CA2
MDRVTLPKVVHKVQLDDEPDIVRRASIPAGETLPAWEHIPLDAKFPMIPAPRGTVVLATTELCEPKHYTTNKHEFDLSDPYALVMSNDYSALHDPHLKAHFSSVYMRKHLIQNGFITPEGQVVCNLKEFNDYRRYLRKLCLLELARQKRQKEKPTTDSTEDKKAETKEVKDIQELRTRIQGQESAQRQRLIQSMADVARKIEKRHRNMVQRQIERERKRKQYEEKRRQMLSQIHTLEKTRNIRLIAKWELGERKRQERLESMRKQQLKEQQQRVISKWRQRRRFQESQLAIEAEKREEMDREKQKRVENRKNKMKRVWEKQEALLKSLQNESSMKRDASRKKYDRRMSSDERGRRSSRSNLTSPFQSMWVIEKVLRRLSFPDVPPRVLAQDQGDALWEFLDGIINNAVEILKAEGGDHELDILKEGAQTLVTKTLDCLTQEKFPEVIICFGEPSSKHSEEHPQDNNQEADIVTSTEEALATPGSQSLQAEEKTVIPVPSSVAPDRKNSVPQSSAAMELSSTHLNVVRHSMIRFEKVIPDKGVVDVKTAISSLKLLLEDIAMDRCSRRELEMIVKYAARDRGWWDSGANNLVEIMLKTILSELRTGNVNNDGLSQLILSVVGIPLYRTESHLDLLEHFLAVVVRDISEQLKSDSLSDNQLQCLTTAITSLFLDPEIDIAGTVVTDMLARLRAGATGNDTERNTSSVLSKAIVGKVLKHLAFFMAEWDGNNNIPTHTANVIASKTLAELGTRLTAQELTQRDAVGSSIIAEWIISQALSGLTQHGPLQDMTDEITPPDEKTENCAEVLANDVIQTMKRELTVVRTSSVCDKKGVPIVKDIVQNVVNYIIDPKSLKIGDVHRDEPAIAMRILQGTLIHLSNIVTWNINTTMAEDEEADYTLAKTMVAYSLRQIATCLELEKYDEPKSSKRTPFITKMLEEMGETRIVSSIVSQDLLGHESSSVALHILLETMKQLTTLFSDEDDSMLNKTASKTVEDSLKALASSVTKHVVESASSPVVVRIVNETLKCLRGTNPNSSSWKGEEKNDNLVNETVFNTLTGLLDVVTSVFSCMETDASMAEFEVLAQDMIFGTFQQTLKSLLNATVKVKSARSDKKSPIKFKIVCETIRHLTRHLMLSTATVQDNIDLDGNCAASQLVRHTLEQFSEVMVRSVSRIQLDKVFSPVQSVTEGIKKLATAISDGSMTIGDKQNLTLPSESKKLVNKIKENLLNLMDETMCPDTQHALFHVLKQTAFGVSESLSASNIHSTDTLVLANHMVNDILNDLATVVASARETISPHDASVVDQQILNEITRKLDIWTAAWPTMAMRASVYDFNGCPLIAGDIVKRLLTKLTASSYRKNSKFPEASHHFVVVTSVCAILNRLAFGASMIVDRSVDVFESSGLGKQTDCDILRHLLQEIKENQLPPNDVRALAETIIPTFSIVNFPALNKETSNAVVGFVMDFLTTMQQNIEDNTFSEHDLAEVRDEVFHNGKQVRLQRRYAGVREFGIINTRELMLKVLRIARDGEFRQSEIDRISRNLLKLDTTKSDSQTMTLQTMDEHMEETIHRLRDKLLSAKLSTTELKKITAGIVDACTTQTYGGNDSEAPLTKVMGILRTLSSLQRVVMDIEDGRFTYHEISRLAYSIVASTSEKMKHPSTSEIPVQELNASVAAAITEQIKDILQNLKNDHIDEPAAEKMAAVILSKLGNGLLNKNVFNPVAWKGLSNLLITLIQALSQKLRSFISSLTLSVPVHLVCDDAQPSSSYIINRNAPKLTLQGIEPNTLNTLVRCALKTLIRRLTTKSESENQQDNHPKIRRITSQRAVDLDTTRTVLVALSKTYADLDQLVFHKTESLKNNVGISVRRALLQLVHDIDLRRLSTNQTNNIGETLLKWWEGNKASYESTAANEAMKAVSSLVDKIKVRSKIVGPPRQNEQFATVKITEERVRGFIKQFEEEENELLKALSQQSLISPRASAEVVVESVLRAMYDDTWMDEEMGVKIVDEKEHHDVTATKAVTSLSKPLDSDVTDAMEHAITSSSQEKHRMKDNQTNLQTTLAVESGIVSSDSLTSALESAFVDITGPSVKAEPIAKKISAVLQEYSTTSCSAEDITQPLVEVAKQDLVSKVSPSVASDLARKAAELTLQHTVNTDSTKLQHISNDNIVQHENGESLVDSTLTPNISQLAQRIVDSTIRLLITNNISLESITHKFSKHNSSHQSNLPGKDKSVTVTKLSNLQCPSTKSSANEEWEKSQKDSVPQGQSSKHSNSPLNKDANDFNTTPETISQMSQVEVLAVKSLVESLTNENIEPAKITSYIQKAEERDPALVKVISGPGIVYGSDSLTEQIVQMILTAMAVKSEEADNSTALSDTSNLTDKVVRSLIRLIDKSQEDLEGQTKATASALSGLVDTIEKDLEKAIRRSQEDNSIDVTDIAKPITSVERKAELTTLDRIKEILLRIIEDVSTNRLTTDQLEDIASAAVDGMTDKSSPQPLPSARSNSASSGAVIQTLQAIINDIDVGHFRLEDVERIKSQHFSQTTVEQKEKMDNSDNLTEETSKESISNIIKDILNRILDEIKTINFSTAHGTSLISDEADLHKQNRVRAWILDSHVYCDNSHLIQEIAVESIHSALERIKENKMSESETLVLADVINEKVASQKRTDASKNDTRKLVVETLENTLLMIDRNGLSTKMTDNLVKAVLRVMLMNTEPQYSGDNPNNVSPSKRNNVVRFLSKILTHLLTVTSSVHGEEGSEAVLERDSVERLDVPEDADKKSQSSTDPEVNILPTIGGEELHLDAETTATALSAISIRGRPGVVNPHNPIPRNSFRDLHRPELGRTEVLSHGKPVEVEAKLQKVAEENIHLVHDVEDSDMTTIAEAPSSVTCSSSSASGSPTDLDGKLQNIVSLTSPDEDLVMVTNVEGSSSVIHSNTNTNSPKPISIRRKYATGKTKVDNTKMQKTIKVTIPTKIRNKAQEVPVVESRSKSEASLKNRPTKSPSMHLKQRSTETVASKQGAMLPQRKKSPSPTFKLKMKKKVAALDSGGLQSEGSTLPSVTGACEIKEQGPQILRVQSLSGFHSTPVTIRELQVTQIPDTSPIMDSPLEGT